ncbi:MAG: hypothetical protein Kow00108_26970 [Calditrichia bacterium]
MLKVVRDLEQRSVYNLVVIMEHWSDEKFKDKAKNFISQKKSLLWLFVKRPGVLLFLGASLTRLYVVLRYPEPMGRDWYIYLSDLKYIQKGLFWKELFIDRGSAVISSFYSVLTQTTPELFLHIAGAILFGFQILILYRIFIIIFPEIKLEIVAGLTVLIIAPTAFFPVLLENQVEWNPVLLKETTLFGLLYFMLLDLKVKHHLRVNFAFIFSAVIILSLFYGVILIIPICLIFILLADNGKELLVSFLAGIIIAAFHFVAQVVFTNDSWSELIRGYFFIPGVFSYFPYTLIDWTEFNQLFTGLFLLLLILSFVLLNKWKIAEKVGIISAFGLFITIPFIEDFGLAYSVIDIDQLSNLWPVIILFTLFFLSYTIRQLLALFIASEKLVNSFLISMGILTIALPFYFQLTVGYHPVIKFPLPSKYYKLYHQILQERVPYSYAVVGPSMNRILAENKHFFMGYDYFLNEYGKLDSLYHDVLLVKGTDSLKTLSLPPSILIFIEKPPYSKKNSELFYPSAQTMERMLQWIERYKSMPRRIVKAYYEDKESVVYEIINVPKKSRVWDMLLDMQ